MAGKTRFKLIRLRKLHSRLLGLAKRFVEQLAPAHYFADDRDNSRDELGTAWTSTAYAVIEAEHSLEKLIKLLEEKAAAAGPPAEMPDFAGVGQVVKVEVN